MFIPVAYHIDNVSTQIRQKKEYVNVYSNTLLKNDNSIENNSTLNILTFFNNNTATQVNIVEDDDVNSTWSELLIENMDIVSNLTFKSIFVVKSKVKKITKFVPKIVIE